MILDPGKPNQALDEDGHLNYAVRLYRLDADGLPVGSLDDQHGHIIGWALPVCFRCNTQHAQEVPCRPTT